MPKQNIFDNEAFYEGYKTLRDKEDSANILFEIPALMGLIPGLTGKRVLDLGCGFGEHCKMFLERGAQSVVGVDISQRMLEVAKRENSDPKITYLRMAMEDLDKLTDTFDVAVSSLAMHYVEDYRGVVGQIYRLLERGGCFVFSQEHPLTTCYLGGKRWTKDENGNKLYLNLSGYGLEGQRDCTWFVEHIEKYHRTFSTVVNTLTEAGFAVERVVEPLPTEEILARHPEQKDLFMKPDFLLIRARK